MLLYLFSIVLCLWGALCKNKFIKFYVLFFLLLFLCFGYMTGSDWRNYEVAYNSANFKNILEERFEIGYGILQSIGNSININFWTFHIGVKTLVFFFLCHFTSYCKINSLLFWTLFLPEMGFYLFIDCPFRNLIAFGIFCLAVPALLKRRIKLYFLLVTIAICFHTSAIILYFIYFLWGKNLKCIYWGVLFVLANIVAYDIENLINNVLSIFFTFSPFIKEKLLYYVMNDDFIQNKINIGTIYRVLLFILFVYFRKDIIKGHKYGTIFFYLSMIYFVIYPFTISLKIFSRFSIYLLPFCLLSLIVLLRTMKKTIIKCSLFSFILLWTFAKSYTVLTADCRYIPYSNYLQYMLDEKPSYRYRSNYNYYNSPYEQF